MLETLVIEERGGLRAIVVQLMGDALNVNSVDSVAAALEHQKCSRVHLLGRSHKSDKL